MKNQVIYRFSFLAFCVLSLCFIYSCSEDPLENEEELIYDLAAKKVGNTSLIEGHYIVVLSALPGKKNPKALAALETLSKEIGQMPDAKISRKYSHALTGFAAKLTDKQVEKLKKDPRVESIIQDSRIYPSGELAVQQYPDWGLDRIDQQEIPLDRVYSYTATGKGVTAYLVDTGIRYSHSEFGDRASSGYDLVWEEEPENRNNLLGEGADCWEGGHGTPVASALGGAQYGVAKDVKMVSVRVWGCEGFSPNTRIVAAVDWITANASLPAVVNMSGAHADSLVAIAIRNSINEGIVYVGVAGNQNEDKCEVYPTDLSGRLSVGASDINDSKASFSSYGNCVDLYAPGVSISSASNMDDVSFIKYSGTSISSSFVAGVAALYLEVNPEATPAQIKTAIVNNSTPNAISGVPSGPNNLLYSLWEPVEFTPPSSPNLLLQATGEKVRSYYVANLTWKPTYAEEVWIYEDGVAYDIPYINDGEQQVRLRDKGRDATYILKICEVGYENCSEEVILVFGDGGQEPVNASPLADFNYSKDLLNVHFSDASTDPDGYIVKWNWDFGDGTFSSVQNPSHYFNQAGSFSVKLTVTDDGGSDSSITKNIIVEDQEPSPTLYELTAVGYKVKGEWMTDLSWTPSNPDKLVDIFRNGKFQGTVPNSGGYTDATGLKGGGSLTYKICDSGTTSCSNEVTVQF